MCILRSVILYMKRSMPSGESLNKSSYIVYCLMLELVGSIRAQFENKYFFFLTQS